MTYTEHRESVTPTDATHFVARMAAAPAPTTTSPVAGAASAVPADLSGVTAPAIGTPPAATDPSLEMPGTAQHYRMRATLDKLRAAECLEKKQALLQIIGFDRVENERELALVVNTLRRSAYPGRSGGIH